MFRDPRTVAVDVRRLGSGRVCRCALVLPLIVLLSVAAGHSWAQAPSAREYTIKAAYLYNFVRYIEWPASAFEDAASPIVIGVLGQVPPDMNRSLSFYEKAKKVRGRTIKIRRFKTADDIKNCHLLFLTKSIDSDLREKVVLQLADNPVLLVGETSDFLEQGGAISFMKTSNKVGFRLALKKTQSKGLKPSAKLLQVAQVTD